MTENCTTVSEAAYHGDIITTLNTDNRHLKSLFFVSSFVMFNEHFRSNGTSGHNAEYHMLFVWTSHTRHTHTVRINHTCVSFQLNLNN
jgi:hypothetical protein